MNVFKNCHYVLYLVTFWFNCNSGAERGTQRAQGARAPKAPSIFTNILLHRRVLFHKFTDIMVMFLSRDSLY